MKRTLLGYGLRPNPNLQALPIRLLHSTSTDTLASSLAMKILKETMMATLAGQRAQFTWALNQYNLSDDADERAKFAERMAKYISAAPTNGFTTEEVTQGQSYPATEVAKYLNAPGGTIGQDISEEGAIQSLAAVVDTSDVIREGEGIATLYAYGYRCAPDRLKIGITEGDTIQRIAAQISTSTPDKPMLLLEIKTNACRALERAMHGILETRGQKVTGGGAEWFRATRDEILKLYKFIARTADDTTSK